MGAQIPLVEPFTSGDLLLLNPLTRQVSCDNRIPAWHMSMTRDSEVETQSCGSRNEFRDQLAVQLARNLCLRDFPCQEVERHSKPEIESGRCPELLLPPVTVHCTASEEQCLIEPSINATRVSFMFNWGEESPEGLDKIMAESFFRFLGVKADQLPLLRRAPVHGYNVSFLITAAILQRYGMMNIVVSWYPLQWTRHSTWQS